MKNCSSTGFVRVILQQGAMLLHVLSVPIALPLGQFGQPLKIIRRRTQYRPSCS